MCVETQMTHYLIGFFVMLKKPTSSGSRAVHKGKKVQGLISVPWKLQILIQMIGLDPESGKIWDKRRRSFLREYKMGRKDQQLRLGR